MDKQIALAWAEALRSGRFRQGRGEKLCKMGKTGKFRYDVLGVLMELAIDAGVPVIKIVSGNRVWYMDANCQGTRYCFEEQKLSCVVLTPGVRKWAGLFSPQGTLRLDDGHFRYICDNEEETFDELADIIEANAAEIT